MSWGTANNSILQPLNVLHNIILRIMTFSNYSCHVTPLYKNLNVLKLNDRLYIGLNWQNLCINYIMVRCPKSLTISSKIFLIFIHTKLDSLTTKISYAKSVQILEKSISYRKTALGKEIEQSLRILPYVTFCKHYKDRLLNYE